MQQKKFPSWLVSHNKLPLGIPRKNPKAAPVKTGAVAPDVGRLEPGKLDIKEKKSSSQRKTTVEGGDENSGVPTDSSNNGDLDGHNRETESCDSINGDTETDSGFKDDSDSMENKSDDGDFEIFQNCNKDEEIEANDNDKTTSKGNIRDSKGGKKKGGDDEDTDKMRGMMSDNEDGLGTSDYEDDSSDFTSDEEDNAIEFMPDGEIVRKKSRGFKQLNNCKRFWKASLMLDKGKQTNKTIYSRYSTHILVQLCVISFKYFSLQFNI